jgi:hypothetical protein
MPDDESLTLKSFRRTPRLAHPIARKFHGHLPCFLVIFGPRSRSGGRFTGKVARLLVPIREIEIWRKSGPST